MRFIKAEGILMDDKYDENNDNHSEIRKLRCALASKMEEYNESLDNSYFFISTISSVVTIGAIVDGYSDFEIEKEISKFLKALELEVKDYKYEEITTSMLYSLLSAADGYNFIFDDGEILDKYKIECSSGFHGRGLEFGENILKNIGKDKVYEESRKLLSNDYLVPELNRIYSKTVKSGKYGHPVHYLVETDDLDLRKGLYKTLLHALMEAGRLQSRRYSFINIDSDSSFSKISLDNLYNANSGGTIVSRIKALEDEESNYASREKEKIRYLLELAKKYRNKVLTILCVPRECSKLKELFYEELDNFCLVEIKEDFAKNENAKGFLKLLAIENHIRTDKTLFEKIEPDQGYLAEELRNIFNEWYDKKLRNNVFPQYNELISVRKAYQKEKPKGNSYEELNEMIGLEEAKEVLNNALDYYKAQKLFKEKGMTEDRIAMHMAFTGNPGSAKTSCARLFAKILKENNILSTGNFVELTADMLKGKYVGWTAPKVKEKFDEAKGGVLFLDEIYSLNGDDTFSMEAISSIVSEMENHRNEVICIFAGYPKETEEFLNRNPGLRSRIAFHVPFSDYSVDELLDITNLIAKNNNRMLTEEANIKLKEIFNTAINEPDFGNGRFCRNIFEKAKMAQSARLVSMNYDDVTKEDIRTITDEDIKMPNISSMKKKKAKIGFAM